MEFIGRDADFRAHAEFAAVGELGRRVMQNDGAVDAAEETRSAVAALAVMMDSVCAEPYFAMCAMAASTPSTTLAAMMGSRYSVLQSASTAGLMRASSRCNVSSPRTSQPASSNDFSTVEAALPARSNNTVSAAPHTPVRRSFALSTTSRAMSDVGIAIHIHVTVAIEMTDDRNARFFLHSLHQTAAAARHDDVDELGHARQHETHCRAIGGRHDLNRRFGQAGSAQSGDQALVESPCSSGCSRCRREESPRCPTSNKAHRRRQSRWGGSHK